MSDDILERLKSTAPKTIWDNLDAIAEIERLRAENAALRQSLQVRQEVWEGENDELRNVNEDARAEIERLRAALSSAGLGDAAVAAIRALLRDHDVPEAAYIDDHVANAIAERNQARAENDRLQGRIEEWSKANLAIVAKCSAVERENATLKANAIERAEQAEAAMRKMIDVGAQADAEVARLHQLLREEQIVMRGKLGEAEAEVDQRMLDVAVAAEAAARSMREIASRTIREGQETFESTPQQAERRFLTPRRHGNQAGLAYADAIDALPLIEKPKP